MCLEKIVKGQRELVNKGPVWLGLLNNFRQRKCNVIFRILEKCTCINKMDRKKHKNVNEKAILETETIKHEKN